MTNTNKRVYIFRGASTSGKTKLANLISDHTFSADEMPGLYLNGKYQLARQADSHVWCKQQFINAIKLGKSTICLANTNAKISYFSDYIQLALEAGYSVQVVHCEKVLLPNGRQPENIHNTPQAVIDHQNNGFESFVPKPLGISPLEVSYSCKAIYSALTKQSKVGVICDLNKTLILPMPSKTFINKKEDAQPNLEVIKALAKLKQPITILSNQCGVGSGKMTIDALFELACQVQSWLIENEVICPAMYFATHRNSQQYISFSRNKLETRTIDGKADKPNPDLLLSILTAQSANSYWYVGDSHTEGRYEDLALVRKIQNHSNFNQSLTYIPVEILPNLINETS